MEELGPEPGMNQGFSPAQWPPLSCWGWDWVPGCWSGSLEGQVQAVSIPSKCALPALGNGAFALEGGRAESEGLKQVPSWVGARVTIRRSVESQMLSIHCLLQHR